MDRKDFAIGLLSTTATILLVGLLVVQSLPDRAVADGMTTSAANDILTVGSVSKADEEFVYLIDTASDKMIAYRFDVNQRQIEVVQWVDLAELRRGLGDAPGQQPAKPARSRQP